MKVLITGGAGFIGHHLAASLHGEHTVRVLDALTGAGAADRSLPPTVWFVQGDILDERLLFDAVEGVDAVVHLAAQISAADSVDHPRRTHRVNATGTLHVLEAAHYYGVKRVILASSAAVYGDGSSHSEVAPVWPVSPYGASKLAAEGYAAAYAASHGLDVKVLRLFNVYGPGQDATHPYAPVVARFVDRAMSGMPLVIHGNGAQTREFVHVYTVCDVIRRALADDSTWGGPVNVAFGQPVNLLELAQLLAEAMGRSTGITWAPRRPGDIFASHGTGELLRTLMPDIEPVSLQRGLASLVRP